MFLAHFYTSSLPQHYSWHIISIESNVIQHTIRNIIIGKQEGHLFQLDRRKEEKERFRATRVIALG